MSDAAVAIAQGNGAESRTFQMLIELVRQVSEMSATLRIVADGQNQLRDTTAHQVAALQERVGKSETMNEVQNQQIKHGEQSEMAVRADIQELKASISKQFNELEIAHNKELAALRIELAESAKMRWMIRGGLLVVTMVWPVVWQLFVAPMIGR